MYKRRHRAINKARLELFYKELIKTLNGYTGKSLNDDLINEMYYSVIKKVL